MYYNVLSLLVEHWSHIHQLNGTLVKLVEFIALDYRVKHRMLNPLALPCKCDRKNKNNENKEHKRNALNTITREEWIDLEKVFACNVRRRNSKPIVNFNPHNILAELIKDEDVENV